MTESKKDPNRSFDADEDPTVSVARALHRIADALDALSSSDSLLGQSYLEVAVGKGSEDIPIPILIQREE